MRILYKILILAASTCLLLFLSACNDQTTIDKPLAPEVVSGKIFIPVAQNQTVSVEKKNEIQEKEMAAIPEAEHTNQIPEPLKSDEKPEYYDAQGRIDPFLPLIQEKAEEPQPAVDDNPQRILTPLEKIELGQIRLVAIVTMGKKKIAMVEEATGKGYEVRIGTYIGRNQGKVSEINDSSIIVTEFVKDFRGKLKELTQEIKLHKNDED